MLSKNEKLVQIATDANKTYGMRKMALDILNDERLVNQVAENAADGWIRLESAALCNNRRILQELLNHDEEGIRLEAAIELNDQATLARIVLFGTESYHRRLALHYITNKLLLRSILKRCNDEKEKVETALRLGDPGLSKSMITTVRNEELKLRMAESVHDLGTLSEISGNANDRRVRQFAHEWISGLKPDSDID